MDWLNYHHLLYFWMVAKEGTVTAAAAQLRLSQPTVSGQIRQLEDALGEKLFDRVGRRLELTEVGTVVYRYADEIFGLGKEMMETLKGLPSGRPSRLQVGISDLVPKLISHRLLEPALRAEPAVQIVCREDKTERLLAELAIHGLDLVIADSPIGGQARVRAYNHLLGECGISFYGARALREEVEREFPRSLHGRAVLLPTENNVLRRALDHWFEELRIRPRVVAEFEDSALMKVFGQHGAGIFPAPSAIESEICNNFGVSVVGRTDEVRERFYAITVERRIKHPAVRAITDMARSRLFDRPLK